MKLDRLIDEVLSAPPARGRRPSSPLQATIRRQLDRADIESLHESNNTPGPSQRVSPIQRLRTSHHMLAKLVAEGRPHTECAMITGYSQSYISNIQHEPMFADLVKYYREQLGEVYLNVHQRLASLGMDVVDEIQSRLNEDSEQFSIKDLEEIGKMALDRAGYGPQSTVNHKGAVAVVTPEHLDRIKDEIERSQSGKTLPLIDATPNQGAPDSGADPAKPLGEATPERNEGEGDNVSESRGEVRKGEIL